MDLALYMWHDNRHPDGPLYQKFGHRVVYDATSSINAKLSSVIQYKAWNWGSARSDVLVSNLSKLPLIDIGECDKVVWIPSKSGIFSISSAWDQIRKKKPTVS